MITSTWNQVADGVYSSGTNWSAGVPGFADTAEFESSITTNISIFGGVTEIVGGWLFNPGASQYNFEVAFDSRVMFEGNGITVNAGSVHIFNFDVVTFFNGASAGAALIDNFGAIGFAGTSSAGTATIHTYGGGTDTEFAVRTTGDFAQFITDAGGIVDFSGSAGPDGLGHITAGSIAGAGTYELGANQLAVGLNGLSTEVSGLIEDGGEVGGIGASLVKVGNGTLKLSGAGNTYSGGTTLEAGALDLAAVGAAGPGAISFAGPATLTIENSALSAHHFGNPIDFFAKHDVLDLTGLKFHAGATAIYHKAAHTLTVHSGHVTDTLTLLSPLGAHFHAATDHHGGTDVFLVFG
jgi:autotransporter-associated beta strand protein